MHKQETPFRLPAQQTASCWAQPITAPGSWDSAEDAAAGFKIQHLSPALGAGHILGSVGTCPAQAEQPLHQGAMEVGTDPGGLQGMGIWRSFRLDPSSAARS